MPIPASPRGAPPARPRLWALLALSIAVGLLAAAGALEFLTGQIAPQPQPGAPAIAQVAGTVVCLCLLFLSARAAAELEHRLRRHRPEAQELDSAHDARADATPSGLF